ncbi:MULTISPECIES: hypothetical protein [Bacillaceae]|nr:hypothetical protein [Cytobacillus sp. IB215316]MDX8360457.1 hypothetical protein [Cytobacillus sp. IB215316]
MKIKQKIGFYTLLCSKMSIISKAEQEEIITKINNNKKIKY